MTTTTLTNTDRDIFLNMLENPQEPNEALKKAAQSLTQYEINNWLADMREDIDHNGN